MDCQVFGLLLLHGKLIWFVSRTCKFLHVMHAKNNYFCMLRAFPPSKDSVLSFSSWPFSWEFTNQNSLCFPWYSYTSSHHDILTTADVPHQLRNFSLCSLALSFLGFFVSVIIVCIVCYISCSFQGIFYVVRFRCMPWIFSWINNFWYETKFHLYETFN